MEGGLLGGGAAGGGRGTIPTRGKWGGKVLGEVPRRNAGDRAQEAIKALRGGGVFRHHESGEGLAGLGVVGSVPEIEALHAALAAYGDALPTDPADGRTREQRLLDVLLDLVLRPGAHDLPPVRVVLTLVAAVQTALGGDAPAELNGRIVSAETARQLLNALTGAGLGDGVLAELRRIADPTDPGPTTEEAQPDEAKPAGREPADHQPAGREPADHQAAGGGDRFVDEPGWEPWEPDTPAARQQWAADWER